MCRAEARTAKELGEAREAINPGTANLKSSQVNHLERSESTPEPEYTGRTLTAEERMAAAAANIFTFSPADLGWLVVTGGCYLSTSTWLRWLGMTGFLWVVGKQLAILLAQVSQHHRLVVIV